MRILSTFCVAVLLTLISACSGNGAQPETWSEKKLYHEARSALEDKNYLRSVELLQLLEARYPFGPYADQAQLELIFAHYRSFEPEAAIVTAERFIRLHPQHPHVDYAYYMMGLAKFTQTRGLFDRFMSRDLSKRDPGPARESFHDFSQLILRFPDSDYAADAKARMIHLRNLLARNEVEVANYHFKRGSYLAAAKRGDFVIENYPKTPAVADALAVKVQAYLLLDIPDLAEDSLTVLRQNYPEHPSLDKEGNFKTRYRADKIQRSWVNIVSFGLLDHPQPPSFDTRPDKGY